MQVNIYSSRKELGRQAALLAAARIQEAMATHGEANIVLATGASQFETLGHLVRNGLVEWSKVTMFHLDEYLGLPESHPAGFRKYLRERFVDRLPGNLKAVHFIRGEASDPQAECDRLSRIISAKTIHVALAGIGENGHLAFNDPPADFDTRVPFILVDLDEACRAQQWKEGWFADLAEVPRRAISMSIHQIMLSECIVCSVPDSRKAEAVKNCLEGVVTNRHPASILQRHPHCAVFLDGESSARLTRWRSGR